MRTTIALLLLATPLAALAASRGTQAAHVNDLVALRTVTLAAPTTPIERKPVSFAWALDPTAGLGSSAPFVAESREYWTQVDAAELVRGFELDASAPGAVLRISPIANAAPVSSDRLGLSRDGRSIANTTAFAHSASAEQLQKVGMDLGNGSAVVQLDPALGKGRFKLQMSAASGRYLVHVFEPNSPYVLQAQALQANLLADGQLEVSAKLGKGAMGLEASELGGLLVSPSGKSIELSFARAGKGSQRAVARIPADASSEPGLWEVQVFAGAVVDGSRIQRDARTAISVAQPTARLLGSYRFDASRLSFSAPLEVGSPGRYELRATLYATGPDGLARPVAEAHSAAWFEKGSASLSLGFDRAKRAAGLGAPYEVRNLELKDQSRMGQLETRELALLSDGR
jgi:hypothetical protein